MKTIFAKTATGATAHAFQTTTTTKEAFCDCSEAFQTFVDPYLSGIIPKSAVVSHVLTRNTESAIWTTARLTTHAANIALVTIGSSRESEGQLRLANCTTIWPIKVPLETFVLGGVIIENHSPNFELRAPNATHRTAAHVRLLKTSILHLDIPCFPKINIADAEAIHNGPSTWRCQHADHLANRLRDGRNTIHAGCSLFEALGAAASQTSARTRRTGSEASHGLFQLVRLLFPNNHLGHLLHGDDLTRAL